jgi:hypothetical protein
MTMPALTEPLERLIIPYASALVDAMMRSYPLVALTSGHLLIPKGSYQQIIGDEYFLEGNLHGFVDSGPWHEAKATFRLCMHSKGTVLERKTVINCWFDYRIFDRALLDFRATELDEAALRRLLRERADFRWHFGHDQVHLRF